MCFQNEIFEFAGVVIISMNLIQVALWPPFHCWSQEIQWLGWGDYRQAGKYLNDLVLSGPYFPPYGASMPYCFV